MQLTTIRLIFLAITACTVTGLAKAAQPITPSSFEAAATTLRDKCIEQICLGATAKEVTSMGSIEWHRASQPTGQLTCNYYESQTATGWLTVAGGGRYQVNFDTVTEQGDLLSRYRLMAVGIRLKDAGEKDGEFIVSRLASQLKFPASAYKGTKIMTTSNGDFSLIIDGSHVPNTNDTTVMLSASYNLKEQWLRTFPKCAGKSMQ